MLYEVITTNVSTPAATTVVSSAEILNSAAGSLDDVLRNTPGNAWGIQVVDSTAYVADASGGLRIIDVFV